MQREKWSHSVKKYFYKIAKETYSRMCVFNQQQTYQTNRWYLCMQNGGRYSYTGKSNII